MERLMKFGFVGVINTLITMTIYNLLVALGVNYLIANVIGYGFGTINSYILNNNWVFKMKSNKIGTFIKFLSVNILSLVINSAVLYSMVSILDFNKSIAQVGAIGSGMIVNYLANKFWTFNIEEIKEN